MKELCIRNKSIIIFDLSLCLLKLETTLKFVIFKKNLKAGTRKVTFWYLLLLRSVQLCAAVLYHGNTIFLYNNKWLTLFLKVVLLATCNNQVLMWSVPWVCKRPVVIGRSWPCLASSLTADHRAPITLAPYGILIFTDNFNTGVGN